MPSALLARAAALIAAAGVCAAVTAQVATAATVELAVDYGVAGARIYAAPDGRSTVIGLGYPGQGAMARCRAYGPGPDGPATALWVLHRNSGTGLTGWTSGGNLTGWQWNILPEC